MTEEVTNEVSNETLEDNAQPAIAELNINDLVALKNVVDVATTRGAFRANEMTAIGQIYDKLSRFLEAIEKHQPAQPSTTEEE